MKTNDFQASADFKGVFRKTRDLSVFTEQITKISKLANDFERAKELKAVLLPYLDQRDADLGELPDGFVTAEDVADYPTDFSAMSEEWIDRLSTRGEQVTPLLLRQYWSAAV